MTPERLLPTLLLLAWLAPLASFVVSAIAGSLLSRRHGGQEGGAVDGAAARTIGHVATGAIGVSLVASVLALGAWIAAHPATDGHAPAATAYAGEWFGVLDVGPLHVGAAYYIDALTVVMAVVVTLVATCVHVYSFGYLAEETAAEGLEAVADDEAPTYYGNKLRRAGRLHRFYQHLSLFCFAMLGVVLAGNAVMTFAFWELVGASSYLLIGFYYERPKAAAAATKAMLFNRVGDVGMLVGLMALWGLAGTFDYERLFAMAPTWMASHYGLATLVGAGLFCGCIGKSAQVPLQGWLPDAMAGPTPVSALVHSATMVAAGVFLVGRIYPLLTVEVLVGIASVGAVTLLVGATLASVSHDLKRVLAYSTVSQLGYMMLSLGLGGWTAGLFHLVTHAGFKALLFLGAGSVIHAVGTNDLRAMGGLRRAMPATAGLMLVGALALMGAGVPVLGLGLSGFFSKDAIFEYAVAFARTNPSYAWLFWAPLIGAVLTAAYITRLGLLTFVGQARSEKAEHAHESPESMLVPMAVVAAMAIGAGWAVPGSRLSVPSLLAMSAPEATHHARTGSAWSGVTLPGVESAHEVDVRAAAGWAAIGATLVGVTSALLMHRGGRKCETPAGAPMRQFDEHWLPSVSRGCDAVARRLGAFVSGPLDRGAIDGGLAGAAGLLKSTGGGLRRIQTGSLRQYVFFLALGVVLVSAASLGVALRWING
ncbi:NADH-quinone oxidoreductase subunit L [Botrimarina colliarenosi]|uniref:NADH-quinone oxidoreductase subunit L n=1 Tax=Botrimarina colliarenosi TaxID=2528001 RepID=A0A5C6AKN1_9BACT|nr:NADH-quinone oxidoreductase subunit L [Botrimarina colliarenosi]TWU00007.1 NADH-quinone oxidoreductase subunit L [Botrimarina colliarenosi]